MNNFINTITFNSGSNLETVFSIINHLKFEATPVNYVNMMNTILAIKGTGNKNFIDTTDKISATLQTIKKLILNSK